MLYISRELNAQNNKYFKMFQVVHVSYWFAVPQYDTAKYKVECLEGLGSNQYTDINKEINRKLRPLIC